MTMDGLAVVLVVGSAIYAAVRGWREGRRPWHGCGAEEWDD